MQDFSAGELALTRVTKDNVRQKVLARYDDKIGEPIEPGVIDWHAWRADMSRVSAAVSDARLQSTKSGSD
jgi:hypothetical protein